MSSHFFFFTFSSIIVNVIINTGSSLQNTKALVTANFQREREGGDGFTEEGSWKVHKHNLLTKKSTLNSKQNKQTNDAGAE